MQERIPAKTAYETLRGTSYSTDKALAELVDNSIQAGATRVEVLVIEETKMLTSRQVTRPAQISVVDNGSGMNRKVLTDSLGISLGENKKDKKGIGKFGWGLVGSTLSQCRRVDIWSWQNSPSSALHTYLDLDDEDMTSYLYEAAEKELHNKILEHSSVVNNSAGTVVCWTKLDRIDWKKSNSIAKNTAEILGRLYRKKLTNVEIEFHIVNPSGHKEIFEVMPTDPLYLMEGIQTSTPDPYTDTAIFIEEEGSPLEWEIKGSTEASESTLSPIIMRSSSVKPEIYTQTSKSGNEPYGKHANRNKGVSLVRSERELLLDDDWCNETIDRWWGIEILFTPEHDELFGVGKDKQSARIYSDVAHQYQRFVNDAEEWKQYKESFEPGSNFAHMCEIVQEIADTVRRLNRTVRKHKIGTGTKRGTDNGSEYLSPVEKSEEASTKASNERAQAHPAAGIDDYIKPSEQAIQELSEVLIGMGSEPTEANEKAKKTIALSRKAKIEVAIEDSDAFFTVRDSGGVIILSINRDHLFYDSVVQTLTDHNSSNDLNDDAPEIAIARLEEKLDSTSTALFCTLMSWARMEYESKDDDKRKLKETRRLWGDYARDYLKNLE
jgi:hypothetical protein